MSLIELPYNLPGRIFRSEMPFSAYDPSGKLFKDYQLMGISVIVLLAEDFECYQITGFDLRKFYLEQGMAVIHLPIPDFGVPKMKDLSESVETASKLAKQGHHLGMHCHAGIGRTGLFASCLAICNLRYSWFEALSWVRERIPGAVEAPEQVGMIELFAKEGAVPC